MTVTVEVQSKLRYPSVTLQLLGLTFGHCTNLYIRFVLANDAPTAAGEEDEEMIGPELPSVAHAA